VLFCTDAITVRCGNPFQFLGRHVEIAREIENDRSVSVSRQSCTIVLSFSA
jgi:hypothetical protein